MPKRKLIVVIAVLLLLIGGLLAVRAMQANNKDGKDDAGNSAAETVQGGTQRFEIKLAGGRLAAGDATLKAKQGDTVTIKVTSDAADELHLHGYDLSFDLESGKPVERTFTADQAGQFEAELHEAKTPVFVLEVQPE